MIIKDFGYQPLPIEFDQDGHTYKLDGELLVGVSTILEQKDKSVYLIPWAVKEMYNYLNANWDIKKKYTQLEKDELLKM